VKAVALALVLAACGGSHPPGQGAHDPVEPTLPRAVVWTRVGDVEWGITLESPHHYEVDLRHGNKLLAIKNGLQATSSEVTEPPRTVGPAFEPAPELEALDVEFAAQSAKEGGEAWAAIFAGDGAEWSNGKRVEQAQIGTVMGNVLMGATLDWQPLASGVQGDLGFTLGTYTLESKNSSQHEDGSYCTIWRRAPGGPWKVLFDVGSHTEK
jgi:hypothetical protein